jgi:hypothetical protein
LKVLVFRIAEQRPAESRDRNHGRVKVDEILIRRTGLRPLGGFGVAALLETASPLSSKARLISATLSRSRRTDPSPVKVAQSATASIETSISRRGPAAACGSGSRPPSWKRRATLIAARRTESSMTMIVTVAPLTISTWWSAPCARAKAATSRPM